MTSIFVLIDLSMSAKVQDRFASFVYKESRITTLILTHVCSLNNIISIL